MSSEARRVGLGFERVFSGRWYLIHAGSVPKRWAVESCARYVLESFVRGFRSCNSLIVFRMLLIGEESDTQESSFADARSQ